MYLFVVLAKSNVSLHKFYVELHFSLKKTMGSTLDLAKAQVEGVNHELDMYGNLHDQVVQLFYCLIN